MYAKVIVDVAAARTDKAFDYLIPEELEEMVHPGMRVMVPFGPRSIQGFIWKVTDHTELSRVKPVKEVLDPTPVLTGEMLELGEWMAEETVCFLITAYQSMVPSAIRAKPKKIIRTNVEAAGLPEVLKPFFDGKDEAAWDDVVQTKEAASALKQMTGDGSMTVDYQLKDKTGKKMIRMVRIAGGNPEDEYSGTLGSKAVKQVQVMNWMSRHYGTKAVSVREVQDNLQVTFGVLQALIKKDFLLEESLESYRDPYENRIFTESQRPLLTNQQKEALEPVQNAMREQKYDPCLLHGVTGSGKTEVYLRAIEEVLKEEKEAIVLVPEISLTPQMVERFKARFGSEVAVLHSALSSGEKYDEWRKIHRGEVKVAVGARSAVFAPFRHLGLLIIDEEHEGSYKQEDHPRYHARQVALWRGRWHSCPVLMGSATPSLESYARASKNVYRLLEMPHRVNEAVMPEVEVMDMRKELKKGNRSAFSEQLLEKMQDRLEKKEQMVLFLNRRGYSTFVMCRSCGYTASCPHCEITLTYHHTGRQLKCHYCGYGEPLMQTCPDCHSEHIRFFGTGTQKVEEELTRLLPDAGIIRMDVDTTSRKGAHEKLLDSFRRGEADILLGTQMIAKGLDFPKITLVGVLAADTMLHLPDFRASERTFQLLTQVSGRAGRAELPGEVVVQTYTPEHYSIQHAKGHDYHSFAREEMAQRKRAGYPPYYYLTLITIAHEDAAKVMKTAARIADRLRKQLSPEAGVLGPTVSPIARIKDRYRYQCMIKYKNEPELIRILNDMNAEYQKEMAEENLTISIDMEPQMFM
ncbi:replication restart DNA helicase PriA [Salibacterium halotolerans]|uniref:Replication restart protein PriA n=2 Tax=Salibacterium halotolerans TaxID=1884432 RepID=A0A1I5M8Q8_9BACI|nr:replication restart DNA helicase PriA [Salibacterium halotolerans]